MSLFNETVARADRAEKALDLANKRIAELESELKAAKNGNTGKASLHRNKYPLSDTARVWHSPDSFPTAIARSASINSLTTSETESLFAQVAKQADAAGLKPAAVNKGVSVRSRPWAPISKFRVLFLYLLRHRQ